MKKYILDCSSLKSDGDFWDLYCEVVQPEGMAISEEIWTPSGTPFPQADLDGQAHAKSNW